MCLKKHNLERHYNTNHRDEYGDLSDASRQSKLEELKEIFKQHYSVSIIVSTVKCLFTNGNEEMI